MEKLVVSFGGMLSIACCFYLSVYFTGAQGSMAVLPSMGAAAILLFSAPQKELSMYWALFAGNILSAIVGVTCKIYIDSDLIAAPTAIAMATMIMYMMRCLHPPGGATALVAVIGGPAIQDLGYWYVIVPTFINCCALSFIVILFNATLSHKYLQQKNRMIK